MIRAATLRIAAAAAALLAAQALCAPARAADPAAFDATVVGTFQAPIVTWRDIPFRTVVRQRYDYSCGSAALATLLRFHHRRDVDEASIFRAMWEAGDRAKIQKLGFSLLDMKTYLERIGYRADGFRVSLDQVQRGGRPAIALIDLGGYKHFVVIKGVRDDVVLLGDPNRGLRLVSRVEFERQWNGIAFVITQGPERGLFNADAEWGQLARLAPDPSPISISQTLRDLDPIYQLTPRRIIDDPAN